MIVWKLGNKPEKILLKEPHKSFDLTGVEVSLLCIGSEILIRWHKEDLYLCVIGLLKQSEVLGIFRLKSTTSL